MSFPRYPKYKDSGVEWLGQVPEHWQVKRLRFVAELNPPKSELRGLDRETVVSFLPMEAIGDDGSLSLESDKKVGEVENGYTYFRDGDVVLAKITPCYENGKGAVMRGLRNGIGFGTTELIVARPLPTESLAHYLHYLFISSDFRRIGEAHMYGAGGQKRVPDDFVRDFVTAFPPLAEQTRIATLLDRETGKIDELVAEQQRLMGLLKEKRQAVISHAVTKGLNPHAPMKPSGIEWLGKIPEHWAISHLRRLVAEDTTITYGIVQAGPHVDNGIPYIRTSDMSGDKLPEDGYLRTTPEIDASFSRSKVKPNDLVVAIRASLGKGLLVPTHLNGANLTQGTARISPGKRLLPRFLFWSFNSDYCQTSIRTVAKGTTFLEITLDALRRIAVAAPPLAEQDAIVAFLDRAIVAIDVLMSEAEKAVDLLQERRTALISAAVTGQIDVRELAVS